VGYRSFRLFGVHDVFQVMFSICLLYALVGVNLFIAAQLVRNKIMSQFLNKFGKWVQPVLLIVLGLFILKESILTSLIEE
jgi:cadmium resistance protein CadD (predicted permease)